MIVSLYDLVGTALVVLRPTGIRYSNQAGGTTCLQPREEGVLVPIGNDVAVPSLRLMSLENQLEKYFVGPPHHGTGACRGLSEEDADRLDELFASSNAFRGIRVDRSRLADSVEAWVFVAIDADNCVPFDSLGPAYPDHGVLTWTNSD